VGFLDEDLKVGDDDNYGVYRWSLRWDWEVLPKWTIFHQQQGFPEMGDVSNFILNTLQGIRFDVWQGINISAQVQYLYNNKPADDSQKGDTTVFLTLGYIYEN